MIGMPLALVDDRTELQTLQAISRSHVKVQLKGPLASGPLLIASSYRGEIQ